MPRPRTTRRRLTSASAAPPPRSSRPPASRSPRRSPNPPDGGPPQPRRPPNVITTACGPHQTSIVKTDPCPRRRARSTARTLPGAATQIIVPGRPDALREGPVSPPNRPARARPRTTSATSARAIDGAPMNPVGGGDQAHRLRGRHRVRAGLRVGQARRRRHRTRSRSCATSASRRPCSGPTTGRSIRRSCSSSVESACRPPRRSPRSDSAASASGRGTSTCWSRSSPPAGGRFDGWRERPASRSRAAGSRAPSSTGGRSSRSAGRRPRTLGEGFATVAAELNVVLHRRLWLRALTGDLEPADGFALRRSVEAARRDARERAQAHRMTKSVLRTVLFRRGPAIRALTAAEAAARLGTSERAVTRLRVVRRAGGRQARQRLVDRRGRRRQACARGACCRAPAVPGRRVGGDPSGLGSSSLAGGRSDSTGMSRDGLASGCARTSRLRRAFRLAGRARREAFDAHPAELARVAARPDVMRTGISAAAEVGLHGGREAVELYASEDRREPITADHGLAGPSGLGPHAVGAGRDLAARRRRGRTAGRGPARSARARRPARAARGTRGARADDRDRPARRGRAVVSGTPSATSAELLPQDWTLVGGLMVQLHALEHGVPDVRVTADIDVLGQARPPGPLQAIDRALIDAGFEAHPPDPDNLRLSGTSATGSSSTSSRPTASARRPRLTAPDTRSASRAARRPSRGRRPVTVRTDGHTFELRRPTLTGAILIKARSLLRHPDPDAQRQDLLRLLSLVPDPRAMRADLETTERRWLRRAEAHASLRRARQAPRTSSVRRRRARVPPARGGVIAVRR